MTQNKTLPASFTFEVLVTISVSICVHDNPVHAPKIICIQDSQRWTVSLDMVVQGLERACSWTDLGQPLHWQYVG